MARESAWGLWRGRERGWPGGVGLSVLNGRFERFAQNAPIGAKNARHLSRKQSKTLRNESELLIRNARLFVVLLLCRVGGGFVCNFG